MSSPGWLVARGYVALFVLDAAVGLVTGLLALVGLGSALAGPVNVTGAALVAASVLLIPCWLLFARVPAWLCLPPLLVAWELGGLLPVPAVLLDLSATATVGSVVQAVIAAPLALWWWRASPPDGPEVEPLTALVRMPIAGALGVGAAVVQVALMGWSLGLATDGYVRVDWTGLSTTHRECLRDDRRSVHLVGAVHIGEAAGYDRLLAAIPADALLLAEGVDDSEGNLEGFGYDRLAAALGLVPQRPARAAADAEEAEGGGRFRVRRADVDVSSFDPRTLDLLAEVGQALSSEQPLTEWAARSAGLEVSEELLRQVISDILLDRNAHLLGVIDEELTREARLLVPWGALHLRGVQEGLEERGFRCVEVGQTRMLRWAGIVQALARPKGR